MIVDQSDVQTEQGRGRAKVSRSREKIGDRRKKFHEAIRSMRRGLKDKWT